MMTQDEIIRMARESCPYTKELLRGAYYDGFMKAAALVAAHEREKQAEQEPVAWVDPTEEQIMAQTGYVDMNHDDIRDFYLIVKLCKQLNSAPAHTKDMTDDDIEAIRMGIIAYEPTGMAVCLPVPSLPLIEQRIIFANERSDGRRTVNKDEIIKMMSDAGLKAPARGDFIFIHWDQIAMLLNYEREACAKVCDEKESAYIKENEQYGCQEDAYYHGKSIGANDCAAAIRARSDK